MSDIAKYEPSDGFHPMEPLPSIREVCASVAAFERRVLSDAQVSAEDLNDMKCAWYVAASGVPESVLTERERMFLERYRAEGLRFSQHWNLKPEVTALLEEKRREFLRRIENDNKQ